MGIVRVRIPADFGAVDVVCTRFNPHHEPRFTGAFLAVTVVGWEC